MCVEGVQNYADNCTVETIAEAAKALVLPPVVSLVGRYVDVPQSIKDAARPPTGATLVKIKGILPSFVSNCIPDQNNTTFTSAFGENKSLEFLNTFYGALDWSVRPNFDNDEISPHTFEVIPKDQKAQADKQAVRDFKFIQKNPLAMLGCKVVFNSKKQYYASEVFIDDYTQSDDRVYAFKPVSSAEGERKSIVAPAVSDDSDNSDDEEDVHQFVMISRTASLNAGDLPWKSACITSPEKIDTWNVRFELTPLDKGSDTEKGITLKTLFATDLSLFDSSSFRTEYTTIEFSISDNDLDCWKCEEKDCVKIIGKKEQERVKRLVLDNPLALLGYEIKEDDGELEFNQDNGIETGTKKPKKKVVRDQKQPTFPYIVSGYQIRKVLATNFKCCGEPMDASTSKLIKSIKVTNASGFLEKDQIRIYSMTSSDEEGCTCIIESIDDNTITLKGDGIPMPAYDSMVRQIRETKLRCAVVGENDGNFTDFIEVENARGFYVGMPIRLGSGECVETAIIEKMKFVGTDDTNDDDAPLPAIITLDVYVDNTYPKGTVVHDNMSPNEELRLYTLTRKSAWEQGGERDTDEKVLKKAVRADTYAKGEGYFVGVQGVEELNIQCSITFRHKKNLVMSEQPRRDPNVYCGNPMQCMCIGCEEEELQAALAIAESEGGSLLQHFGLLGSSTTSTRGSSIAKK